ncbi:MAG: GvpL/GvpF family gas vesicle protein [Pseudomonadota bacterium]
MTARSAVMLRPAAVAAARHMSVGGPGIAAVTALGLRLFLTPDALGAEARVAVARRLAARAPCLPFGRRGPSFADVDAARLWLADAAARIRPRLDRIGDRREFVFTLRPAAASNDGPVSPKAGATAASGSAYLRAAAQARAAEDRFSKAVGSIAETLRAAAPGAEIQQTRAGEGVDLSLLCGLEARPILAEAAPRLAASHADVLKLSASGPWPPYSFASLDRESAPGEAAT